MDSTGQFSLSDWIEQIRVWLFGTTTLIGVLIMLVVGGFTAAAFVLALRRWFRDRTERVVTEIANCHLRRRATLDDDVMALFRKHDPVTWIRQLTNWKRRSRWFGPILYIQDLDERVDDTARTVVAYLLVKEDDLRMLPAELKRDLYGALRKLNEVIPMGAITKLLSVLDELGSLPTAFDYIPPDEVEDRRSVRLRTADLKAWFEETRQVSTWEELMAVLGHDSDISPEALGESDLVQIEEVARILLAFDQAGDALTTDIGIFCLAAHERLGSDFRQAACIVDKFLGANGDFIAQLEPILMADMIASFSQEPAWDDYLAEHGESPFDVLGVSCLLEQTQLTKRYMELLMHYQPATYEGDDLADRKIEVIEAWKVVDDLKNAGLVG